MRRTTLILAAALVATPAMAGPYLFDLLQIKSYRASWSALFKGEKNVPGWITTFGKTGDGVATPSQDVQVENQDYVVASVCKPHDCGDNMLYVAFASLGGSAFGLLEESTGGSSTRARFFGHPDQDMQDALTSAAKANQ